MKKAILVGIVLIVTFAAAAAVASDTNVSLGLKLWSNAWEETVKSGGGVTRHLDNGSELMAGPSLDVRFLKYWFAGITYLTARGDYESPDWFEIGDQIKFKRKDVDLLAGYLINDPLNELKTGFFVAYKTVDAPASYTNQAAGLDNVDVGTWKLKGPGIGVLAEKRLDELTLLHGSIAYMLMEQEFVFSSGGVSRFDSSGWSLEASVAHTVIKAMSVNVGIKFQRFKGEKVNGDIITDTFSGLTGGIAFKF